MVSQTTDPRITELLQLAIEEGLPLALKPETIIVLEDDGWIVDPFTGYFQRDVDAPRCYYFAVPIITGREAPYDCH